MLSKTNTFNFYRKKSLNTFFLDDNFVFCRFLDQIWLQKTVFWTNIKKMFFSIQYLNILQLPKTFVDNTCVLSYKKTRNGDKSIFYECDKKIIKHLAKKSFTVFKNAKNSRFEHTKTFFWQNVLLFFFNIHEKVIYYKFKICTQKMH